LVTSPSPPSNFFLPASPPFPASLA
jgi:hypothetical protein